MKPKPISHLLWLFIPSSLTYINIFQHSWAAGESFWWWCPIAYVNRDWLARAGRVIPSFVFFPCLLESNRIEHNFYHLRYWWASITSDIGLLSPQILGFYHLRYWAFITLDIGLLSPQILGFYHLRYWWASITILVDFAWHYSSNTSKMTIQLWFSIYVISLLPVVV